MARGAEQFGGSSEVPSTDQLNGFGRELDLDVEDRGLIETDEDERRLNELNDKEKSKEDLKRREELEALRKEVENPEQSDGSKEDANHDLKLRDLAKLKPVEAETVSALAKENGINLENIMDYIVQNLDIDDGPLNDLANEVLSILKGNLTDDERADYSQKAQEIAREIYRLVDQFNSNKDRIQAYAKEHAND